MIPKDAGSDSSLAGFMDPKRSKLRGRGSRFARIRVIHMRASAPSARVEAGVRGACLNKKFVVCRHALTPRVGGKNQPQLCIFY